MSTRRLAIVAALLIALSPCTEAGRESATTTLELDVALPEGATLRVENLIGSITVRASEIDGTARIEASVLAEADSDGAARRLAESITLDAAGDAASPVVHFAYPSADYPGFRLPKSEAAGLVSKWVAPLLNRKGTEMDYAGERVVVGSVKHAASVAVHVTVTVPYGCRASFLQVVGPVHGAGLRGDFELESVDGDLLVEQVFGSVSARSESGTVYLRQIHGGEISVDAAAGGMRLTSVEADEARLRSVEGTIAGDDISIDALRVDTESGDVRLDALEPTEIEVHTDSGTIDLGTQLRRARHASIRSGSGDVTLRLGRLVPFELAAETEKGSVQSKGLAVEVVENGRSATVSRGSNGARLEVATISGKVTLRPL